MFGTLGFSELILILVIVLIIFGAGRLPQIGEGIGKALKGFKKEVHDIPAPVEEQAPPGQNPPSPAPPTAEAPTSAPGHAAPAQGTPAVSKPTAPYQPGPELTPGTTAARMASLGPQQYEPPKPKTPSAPAAAKTSSSAPHVPTMEERMAQPPPQPQGAYPAAPAAAQAKPSAKRPSAIVNKAAVARVQAQQAALRTKPQSPTPSPQDLQSLGESVGDALRTFRQAAADVRSSIDPEMRTIRAEMEAAQKEIEQSVEAAKQLPDVQDDPPKQA